MQDDPPERLDRYLVRMRMVPSRRVAKELIAGGSVRINGRRSPKAAIVGPTDRVEVLAQDAKAPIAAESNAALEVLFEDDSLIVINKPGAIPCHPLRAGEPGTIMNAVVARYPEIASAGDNPLEGGLVHRLDNGTSGALLIVKNSEAFAKLRAAIRAGRIARHYQALVAGRLDRPLELTAPIAHHRKNPRKMTQGIDSSRRKLAGRRALTMVEPIRRVGPYTLVAVRPQSGSRHQIRVHLANAGFPIVGDVLYGGPVDTTLGEGRFWLHLSRIEFESPSSGHVTVSAPLPIELSGLESV